MSQPLIVIAHNIRSTHNVGSIFRSCEGFGVQRLILTGYSPYPKQSHETRLPHIVDKLTRQIHTAALGAETLLPFEHHSEPNLAHYRKQGYHIIGLEQSPKSQMIDRYNPPNQPLVLLLGEEVNGIDPVLQNDCDVLLEIPMQGQKESFNVSVACGIALYALLT